VAARRRNRQEVRSGGQAGHRFAAADKQFAARAKAPQGRPTHSWTMTFHDQVILVTGGSTGIGAATALHLARAGARVIITGRTEATLRETAARDAKIGYVVADVAKPADIARTIATVKSQHGRLDVLVNNAGVFEIGGISDANADHYRRTFDINVGGLIETTRLALPLLRESKGAIVNVASVVADQPFANMSVYSASKAAVLALTRAWAQELAADGVRVNAVSPGPIETPIFDSKKLGISEQQLAGMGEAILQLVPTRRYGKPEEVANVIAFLAARSTTFVTGAQYHVGGGIEA
jgi:NAD(P)-dependent dehydrogenase (short-subunit alcohol dehydrogenase family)